MAIRHVEAKRDGASWRGLVFNQRGDIVRRTVRLYPTSAAALAAAERLWDIHQRSQLPDGTGGAA